MRYLLLLAVGLALLSACTRASPGREVAIAAHDLAGGQQSFEPKRVVLQVGEWVTFVVKNEGKQDHEFESPEAGIEEIVVPPGKTRKTTWRASRSGTFPVYCDLPGHRASGMELTLVVQ